MFSEYEQGRTPNPDILCNREIKFDLFLDAALKLGAEAVATGHYCQRDETIIEDGSTEYELIAGADPNKDQSYFLCQLTQYQLKHAVFPIGNMLKPDLRLVAKNAGIHTADKKDSQGLCFIGKVRLPDFLQQKLRVKPGDIIEVSNEHTTFKSSEKSVTDPFTLTPEMLLRTLYL
jgi:tRNA-specific 2-thiouridylase